jgi:hypothetical protein
MSVELIKYAFVAGELSPTFLGRSDLEKYDLGLAEAVNYFVDYRGGLTTRAGLIFCDFIKDDDKETKMFPFKFAPDTANTYVMLFGHEYIRFVQDGAYVLENDKTITAITKANPGVVTSNAHGFANGDWLKLGAIAGMTELRGRTVVVAGVTTNTFQLKDTFGNNINTTAYGTFTSGTAARIYTVVSPYDHEDLATLGVEQYRDYIRLTHLDYAVRNLIRNDATDWDLEIEEFGATAARPTGLTPFPSAGGSAGVAFVVTAITTSGDESLQSEVLIDDDIVDYSTTAGNLRLTWTPVADAVHYNIYRSVIVASGGNDITRGAQLGYIGRSYGASFTDTNIIPDFTRTPPLYLNPFAPGTITNISVTAGGSGYTQASVLTVTDAGGGTGFVGFPIVDTISGDLVGVVVVNGGENYVTPVASVSIGTGATVTFDISPLTGMWPSLSTIFQQRQIYAASRNNPLTLWGSKPRRFSNFDISTIVSANDSYEFEIDSDEVTPIRHMVSIRGGLLLLTNGGLWLLNGGQNGAPVTANNVLADPQTYTGISDVPPIKIDTDLIYVEGKGHTVRQLSYNDFSRVYSGVDISILSNHLFSAANRITRWSSASDPFKLVYGRRTDGAMLLFTMVKEQNVYAWTRAYTRGLFTDVLAIQDETTDTVYTTVKRFVNGRWTKFLERFAPRGITHVEEAHCVDCGLQLGATYPAASVQASAASGAVTFTASDGTPFTIDDVGKVLRVGGGKATITGYTDSTHITGTLIRPITVLVPEDPALTPLLAEEGDWTLDTPVASVGGLHHLEGETLKVLADGNVLPDKVVTDGVIELGVAATRVIAGLGFTCVAKTLPLNIASVVIEGRRKRVMGLGMRLHEARGLKSGTSRTKLYEMKERTTEAYGEPTNLISGFKTVLVQPRWDEDGSTYVVQDQPLPASILGIVTSMEVGDDPD